LIGTTLGVYKILGELGAGGMGAVYRAEDTTLKRHVAIKVLPDEFAADADRLARLRREAQMLATLNHPHVAAIYGFEQIDGRAFLVMELVEGRGLDDMIDEGPLPVHEALVLAGQIAAGLEAAHEAGMIHRDLKPANIRVTTDDEAKVLDFGLAKGSPDGALSDISPELSMSPTIAAPTMAGVILGTAAYMSPEQARGRKLDRRTDIWSFGCVLYEMLTGQAAFGGDTVTDLLAAVVKDEPDWDLLPAEVPRRVRQLLDRCLTKNARDRLRDIGDARLEIRDAIAGATDEVRAKASDQDTPPRSFARLALAVIVGAALTAAVMSFMGSAQNDVPTHPSLQFEIAPEPGHRILTGSTAPAISALGDAIAYAVHTPEGRQIMVRRLDEAHAMLVPGTEDGRSPFFSHDGQWLGFLTERGMYKVPVDGGRPVALTPGSFWTPRPVWRNEHTILSEGNDGAAGQSGLLEIDANDGSVTVLTTPDSASGEVFHRWPLPMPDGQILFSVIDESNSKRLALYDPEQGNYRVFSTQAGGPFYYRDGQLVFQRAAQMFRASFDPDSGALTASAGLVLEQADPEHLAFAPNGTIVFMHFPDAGGQRIVRVDRQGAAIPLVRDSANHRWLRVSPDGSRVVTGLNQGDDLSELWVIEISSQRRWQLGDSAADGTEPVWSPDGQMVAHSSLRGANYDAYWQPSDGSGEPTRIAQMPFSQWPSSFSPDGKIFMFYGGDPHTDIWAVAIDGSSDPSLVIGGEGTQRGGRFSPDGRYVAYTSDESGRSEIFVQPYPELDRRWTISSSGGTDPVWARNGSELFFRDGTRMISVEVNLAPEFEAGAETVLFESLMWTDPFGDQSYDVFPDGQSFAMFQRDAAGEPRLRVLTGFSTQQPR